MLLKPTGQELIDSAIDVTGAQVVQIQIREDSKVVWVNVDGVCLLRCCQIRDLILDDERPTYDQDFIAEDL